jgi:hypothetical protein
MATDKENLAEAVRLLQVISMRLEAQAHDLNRIAGELSGAVALIKVLSRPDDAPKRTGG